MRTIQEQFEEFDSKNPKVWEMFIAFTWQAIQTGRRHFSADMVLHRIRWETEVQVTFSDFQPNGRPLKINNNFSAFYSRKFAERNPQYADFFRMRNSIADTKDNQDDNCFISGK